VSPQREHRDPDWTGTSDQQAAQIGTEERRGSGEPQTEQESRKTVQLTASKGLRSTRDTARHLEIPDSGTSSVDERESLRKTHLAEAAVAIAATQAQYTCGVKLKPIGGASLGSRKLRQPLAVGQKASAAQDCAADVLVVMLGRLSFPLAAVVTRAAAGMRVFTNPLGLRVFAIGVGTCVADCVLDLANDLFGLAFDLLRSAFGLCACVAGPFANLTLRTAYGIIDCALYAILIHFQLLFQFLG
jgi:hypothetical protein